MLLTEGKELPVKQEIAAQSRSCIKTKVDQCRQQQSRGLRTLKTIQQLEATSDHDYATPTAVTSRITRPPIVIIIIIIIV